MSEHKVFYMFIGVVIGCVLTHLHTRNRLNQYAEYCKATEELLDSIANKDDSFLDTTYETDCYQNYMDAYNNLNK